MNNNLITTAETTQIRRALEKDIPQIVDICRTGFVNSLRWNGLRMIALKWWSSAITTDSAEVWVMLRNGTVAGFTVLVFNEEKWKSEKKIKYGRLMNFLNVMVNPVFVIRRMVQKRKHVKLCRNYHNSIDVEISMPVSERCWIELIAVKDDYRGCGIGRELIYHCFGIAIDRGKKLISLTVNVLNEKAISLYKKCGFKSVNYVNNKIIMVKVLKS